MKLICGQRSKTGLPALADRGLRGGETGDGHTEWAAGNIVQTDPVAELHAHGVAAVLAADAAVQLRTNLLALLHSHLHQGTDAGLIQLGEGVVLEDLGVVVGVQELACVVMN